MMEVTYQFRVSNTPIPNVCTGFFCGYRRLENQFKYVTNTQGLTEVVEDNFILQMGV